MAGDGMDESYSPISVDVKRVAAWKSPASAWHGERGKNGLEKAPQKAQVN
jgi:hypothetical protein